MATSTHPNYFVLLLADGEQEVQMEDLRKGDRFIVPGDKKIWKATSNPYVDADGEVGVDFEIE